LWRARARPLRRSRAYAPDTARRDSHTKSSEHLHLRHIDHPFAAGLLKGGLFFNDFLAMIPGKEQSIVGIICLEIMVGSDRNMRAGAEFPLLDGRRVADELNQVGSDAAIVRHRSALRSRAVTDDALALPF